MEVGEVGGHRGVVVLRIVTAANQDLTVVAGAERVDVTRQVSAHLAFGHGIRYCLGAPLARIELQEVFTQLVTRFPTMRLAVPAEDLALREDTLTGGLVELPVTW